MESTAKGRIVISTYKTKPGMQQELEELVKRHVPELQQLGLATGREPVLMRAADGTLLEVFEWASAEAIEQAHGHPQVLRLWAEFEQVCDFGLLKDVPEAGQPFAEFGPL